MQTNNFSLRKLHSNLAPVTFTLLSINIGSGILYAVFKHVFQIPKQYISWLMIIHQGNFFGVEWFKALYCAVLALFLLAAVVATGFKMIRFNNFSSLLAFKKKNLRNLHHLAAILLFIPLALVISTGGLYRVVRYLDLLSKANAKIFLWLHAGTCFPVFFQMIYIFAIGVPTFILSASGFLMWRNSRLRKMGNRQTFSILPTTTTTNTTAANDAFN